jgi:hypothetical protein
VRLQRVRPTELERCTFRRAHHPHRCCNAVAAVDPLIRPCPSPLQGVGGPCDWPLSGNWRAQLNGSCWPSTASRLGLGARQLTLHCRRLTVTARQTAPGRTRSSPEMLPRRKAEVPRCCAAWSGLPFPRMPKVLVESRKSGRQR